MAQDAARASDGLEVQDAPSTADERRGGVLREELKAARQRVKDAEKHLAALEKETAK